MMKYTRGIKREKPKTWIASCSIGNWQLAKCRLCFRLCFHLCWETSFKWQFANQKSKWQGAANEVQCNASLQITIVIRILSWQVLRFYNQSLAAVIDRVQIAAILSSLLFLRANISTGSEAYNAVCRPVHWPVPIIQVQHCSFTVECRGATRRVQRRRGVLTTLRNCF